MEDKSEEFKKWKETKTNDLDKFIRQKLEIFRGKNPFYVIKDKEKKNKKNKRKLKITLKNQKEITAVIKKKKDIWKEEWKEINVKEEEKQSRYLVEIELEYTKMQKKIMKLIIENYELIKLLNKNLIICK